MRRFHFVLIVAVLVDKSDSVSEHRSPFRKRLILQQQGLGPPCLHSFPPVGLAIRPGSQVAWHCCWLPAGPRWSGKAKLCSWLEEAPSLSTARRTKAAAKPVLGLSAVGWWLPESELKELLVNLRAVMLATSEEVKCEMSLPAELSCLQGGGEAEGEAALATLEKQLICPICLELFNKPVVILPCQHNLCRKCANELYQPSLFLARTTMQVNSGRFRCPSCRQEVVLDRHGVYGLQRNLLVENIIDVYKQEVSNNSNAASPLPPPPPLPAQVTCSDHEGERVNIYCLTCQVPTCSLCKVFGAHQSCQVTPLTDIYQQKKDELSEGVSSLVAVNDKVQALINELEETCKNIEDNCKTQKQSVCEKFNRVFSILEERRKVMTQRISSEQEEKTSHAQSLVRCYGDSVEANSKLVERAVSSMEESDIAAFVQNSRELITKVITATGSCPSETLKPGCESLSHYIFNFSRQERALKSIDFLKVLQNVPEEPEVEKEPEVPRESSVQIVEPKHHQDTSPQNPESVVEPIKELIPTPISPPVKTAAPTSASVPPAPGLVRDPVEHAWVVLQPETEDPDLNDGESGLMKNNTEDQKEQAEGCAAPGPGKEGAVCEEQEGMSTQQCETVSDADDWTAQSEAEDKQDAEEEEEEEEEEEDHDLDHDHDHHPFYPNYKPNSWRRLCSDPTRVPRSVSSGFTFVIINQAIAIFTTC
ncbi:tripartite motif-containing protein 55-like [Cyclopterus lumpus]|uniref:tripartite motif-containing protein 55-like n=1 Tax=Cyclopterus lumpus TaxID=8103 RepID=UPI0014861EAD|nr:tripartite motif-containing protein 55-like [Cyclopterus lumpus]